MSYFAKLSVKGQLVIPKDVRDALQWREGQELEVVLRGHSVTLQPRTSKRQTINWDEFRTQVPAHSGPAIAESQWDADVAAMLRDDG